MKETYDVKGMTCASCVSHVEKAAKSVPGVTGASANLLTNQVTVEGTFDEGAVRGAVKKAGYLSRKTRRLKRPMQSVRRPPTRPRR